jgi:hypothetical protein
MTWLAKIFGAGGSTSKRETSQKETPKKVRRNQMLVGLHVVGRGGYPRNVVGESHCQDALAAICGGHNRDGHELEIEGELVPEPSNPYDSNAVMVSIAGQKVGYLSRDDASQYQTSLVAAGFGSQRVKVGAKIVGGWRTNQHDAGHFGVKLALPWPAKFAS